MKKGLRYIVFAIASLLLYSCGKDNGAETPSNNFTLNRDDIIGCWKVIQAKYDEGAKMTDWAFEDTYATFEENGLYKGEGYFGDGEGTYSVSGNVITTKVDNVPYIIYEVTGIEEDKSKANLTATLQSNQMKIWMVVEKSEYIEIVPPKVVSDEQSFNQDGQVQTYVAAIYNDLSNFAERKRSIEEKIMAGKFEVLSATNDDIKNAWTYAYSALRKINVALDALKDNGNSFVNKYIPHLHALRAFVAYNLTSLWGDVPYTTDSSQEAAMNIKICKIEDILKSAVEDIELYNTDYANPFTSAAYYEFFNPTARQLLQGEIELTRGNTTLAKNLFSIDLDRVEGLKTSDVIFDFRKLNANNELEIVSFVYFKAWVDILRKEADGKLEDSVASWKDENVFGYWQLLKRIGKAEEVTGCQAYQLLFPYPYMESAQLGYQNPGY